jgi:hypothetical protein
MSTVHWSDIRDMHLGAAVGRDDVERGTSRLISQVQTHRLANMRTRSDRRTTSGLLKPLEQDRSNRSLSIGCDV